MNATKKTIRSSAPERAVIPPDVASPEAEARVREGMMRIRTVGAGLGLDISGTSKLTSTGDGIQIWSDICAFVAIHSGRTWRRLAHGQSYMVEEHWINVPEGDVEALMHDFCHCIVAADGDKHKPNIGLDEMDAATAKKTEETAWALESWLFNGVMPDQALMATVTPEMSEMYNHIWDNDPLDVMLDALTSARKSGLDVMLCRRVLASWVEWVSQNPAEDQVRRPVGWGRLGMPQKDGR